MLLLLNFFFSVVRRIKIKSLNFADKFPSFKTEDCTPARVRPASRPLPLRIVSTSPEQLKRTRPIEDYQQFEILPDTKKKKIFNNLLKENEYLQRKIASLEESDEESDEDSDENETKPHLMLDLGVDSICEAWVSPPGVTMPDLRTLFDVVLSFAPGRNSNAGKKSSYGLDGFNGLLLTLLILRSGISHQKAANFLSNSASESTARRCFGHWLEAINSWGEQTKQVAFLKPDEWKKECDTKCKFLEDFPNHLIYFVDGTPVATYNPTEFNASYRTWNQKHQIHSFTFFVLVTPTGRIVYVSDLEGGSVHDATHFRKSDVMERLNTEYQRAHGAWTYCIGGDKGYRAVLPPPKWLMLITKSGEQSGDQGNATNGDDGGSNPIENDSIIFSPSIAKHRSVVERVFGRLKEWRILLTKHHLLISFKAQNIVFALCCLHNHFMDKIK